MGRKKKILHVVPELAYGGVEKVVRNYSENIDHQKYSFDYVTHGLVEEYHKELIEQGGNIYYFNTIGQVGIKGYKRQLKDKIQVEKYDIIHIHTGNLTGLYAYIFRCCGAKKIISHAHVAKTPNPRQKLLMPVFRYMSVIFSDELVACGEEAGKFCFGHEKFHFLPNGIDFKTFRNVTQAEIDNLKNLLGIDRGTFVVGHVGRFSKQKNQLFLTEIIHEYLKNNANTKFVLVGDGPDKSNIEKIVKENGNMENVIFTGIRNDVEIFMRMFDLFLLPSLFEGLPVVGIEAQAAGVPCVFSDAIDRTVNLLKNNCTFLPIDQGVECWVKEIAYRRNCDEDICSEEIFNVMRERGYELLGVVEKLCKIYDDLIGD